MTATLNGPRKLAIAFALALLGLLCLPAFAQRQIVIYRCTDASGAVTIQNDTACPKGSKQKTSTIDVPPSMPAYEARAERMPQIVAAEKKQEDERAQEAIQDALPPPVPVAEREAPPPLFQCTTWDDQTYVGTEEVPPQRCVPIQVVGLDGAVNGAAQACRYTTDTCEPIPEDGLCRAWRRRLDEAKFRAHFAGENDNHEREFDYEKMAATVRNSTCGE